MANAVIIKSRTTSNEVDAYNRSAKMATDVPNGTPLTLTFPTTEGDNVFTATKASAGANNVWLAYSPEVNKAIVGKTYAGDDVRYFTNLANKPFDVFKFDAGVDVIQVTKDFFATGKAPSDVAGSTVVELTANGFEAKVSATSSYTGISFNIGRKEPIIIAEGTVMQEGVDAWYLECTQN